MRSGAGSSSLSYGSRVYPVVFLVVGKDAKSAGLPNQTPRFSRLYEFRVFGRFG